MTPDDHDGFERSLQRVVAFAAEADRQQARDILLGDLISDLRSRGHDGGWACEEYRHEGTCRGCDLILRYEDLTQPPARVLDAYRARYGDHGGCEQ